MGRLLGANIAGCVAGALLAGFVLPQFLGLWLAIVAAGALAMAPGFHLARAPATSNPCRRAKVVGSIVLALVVAALVSPAAARLPRVRLAVNQGERLRALTAGTHGIVAVTERPGSRRLKLNNHYGLGGTLSIGDQRMQAHIPLLVHPNPDVVGVLGLGTGLSASGIRFHSHSRADVVELVPEVIHAARAYFGEATGGFLDSPRTRLIPDDARHFLRAGGVTFDVILGDLIVPWRQGEGALFTREHFLAARASLRPGGVFCQWIPMFQVSQPEFQILLRTYLSVFPEAQLWRGDFSPTRPALALVATRDPDSSRIAPDPNRLAARLAAQQPDPANPHLAEVAGLGLHFVGVLTSADLDPGETRLHTEDRPWIELLGPTTHAGELSSQLFIGRPLQQWLVDLRTRSEARLPGLGTGTWNAARQGERLFEFSLLLLERREAEALAVRADLVRSLPPAVARGIFGDAAK